MGAILDHGYVELIEIWGSDERIVEAARMSTGKGFLGWGPASCAECYDPATQISLGHVVFGTEFDRMTCPKCKGAKVVPGDEKLLRYLWENKHATPFEMAGMTIEVKAPIFVFREWHRHRVPFGYNEMSARYVPLPDENYIPTVERLMINSKTNKQAGVVAGATEMTAKHAEEYRVVLAQHYRTDQEMYEYALKAGVPKELARVHLPVGRYSRMRATGNLRGWLAFLTLRMAPGAQYEIRCYANAVAEIVAEKFPRTYELFAETA
jgi:thymidylate synthase (FAD)